MRPNRNMQVRLFETLEAANAWINCHSGLVVWLSGLTMTVLVGGYALLASLLTSMEILEFSIKIPWAAMIATYVFLVATGSGLCIVNALGGVFGLHRFELLAKRMAFLSLTGIVFGMLCIVMHLGHPERMPIYNAISPNFRSAISWMGALYSVYLVFVSVELWLQLRPDLVRQAAKTNGRLSRMLSWAALEPVRTTKAGAILTDPRVSRLVSLAAFVFGASALSMLGSVFAHSESRLLWYGPYYPVYFLISAVFCGLALLLAVTIIATRVRGVKMPAAIRELVFEIARILAVILALGLFLITLRLSWRLLDPLHREPVRLLLSGTFKIGFWGFEIGLMSILAIAVLLWSDRRGSLNGILAGSLMVLIGGFVMRYQFVVAGQVFPNIPQGLPTYAPTTMEVFVVSGVVAAFLISCTLGEALLALQTPAEKTDIH